MQNAECKVQSAKCTMRRVDGPASGSRIGLAPTQEVLHMKLRLTSAIAHSLAVLLATAALAAANGEGTRLLRSPTVSATHIAFAYANNIWVVERAGGAARRLTSFQGRRRTRSFSPDGTSIAFSARVRRQHRRLRRAGRGRRAEAPDLAPRRRHGAGLDARRQARALRLGARHRGRRAPRRASGPCRPRAASRSRCRCRAPTRARSRPTAARIAYRMNNSWDEERRNYRGGQNRPIWIVDLKTYDLVSPPWTDSKDIDPVWVGDTVYFISDRDGVAQRLVVRHQVEDARRRSRSSPTSTSRRSTPARGAVVFEQARLHPRARSEDRQDAGRQHHRGRATSRG